MLFRQHALAIFCSTIMLVCGVACADTKTSREQANLKQETQKQLSSGTEKTESESKEFSNQQLCGRSAESISFNKGSGGGAALPAIGSRCQVVVQIRVVSTGYILMSHH